MLAVASAPAKLNLALELTGKREDGYHLLAAVSQTVAWSDVLAVALGQAHSREPALTVTGPQAADVPRDSGNILIRAAHLLRQRGLGAEVTAMALCKRIPTQSGLGGGSADAAALLELVLQAKEAAERDRVALLCGADVPFALRRGAALLGGVGEMLEPVPRLIPTLILVAVLARVPTASAYAAVGPDDFSDGRRAAAVARALSRGEVPRPELLGSSLLRAALRVCPELDGRLKRLRAATPGLHWAMTGSGGAFFAMVKDPTGLGPALRACRCACPDALLRAVVPA